MIMTIEKTRRLKTLETKAKMLKAEIQKASAAVEDALGALNIAKSQLKDTNKEINKLQSGDPVVTEHAILRYIERGYLTDINAIKDEILSEETKILIKTWAMGNTRLVTA